MMRPGAARAWQRRARPLLGTLVEVGVLAPTDGYRQAVIDRQAAIEAAFAAIEQAQRCLSRFDPHSDVSRFHALRRGECLALQPITRHVLAAAQALHTASAGLFDISLGSAPDGWALDGDALVKNHDAVRLDLGGIGKGHAVDLAVQALRDHGCTAGWVNAGGDLRAFGDVNTPVHLRDEQGGGVRTFALLRDGAFATSAFGPGRRVRLVGHRGAGGQGRHASVAAPLCLWADALTKVVALSGQAAHPLLAHYGARAWLH